MAMLSFLFMVCATRTNLVFVLVFLFATIGFALAGASIFFTAEGVAAHGENLLVATGAMFLIADLLGWYLLSSIMFTVMELPLPDIPVLDLSNIIKAKPRRKID